MHWRIVLALSSSSVNMRPMVFAFGLRIPLAFRDSISPMLLLVGIITIKFIAEGIPKRINIMKHVGSVLQQKKSLIAHFVVF